MEIRIVKDFEKMAFIQQNAYAGSFKGTQDERDELTEIFKDLTENGDITALEAYDQMMMGCVLHYNFNTNFHGQMIQTAGIGSLAVDLLHKKKGVAQNLIQYSMEKAEAEDKELYYLYPFSTGFYRSFGFGYGTPMYTYCVAPKDFMDQGDRAILSYGSVEDLEAMVKLYDDKAQKTNGMSLKTYGDKKRIQRMKFGKILLAKDNEELIGYMIFSQKGTSEKDNQEQKIVVHEMLYNHKALLAFASFFSAQKDQVNYVEIPSHDDRLHHILTNTCFVPEPKTQDIIALKVSDKALGMMPYVLQPQKLLDRLTFDLDYKLVIEIDYPKKEAKTVSVGEGEIIHIHMAINEFSSWITGVITLSDLFNLGLLKTYRDDILKEVDKAFYFEKPISFTRY